MKLIINKTILIRKVGAAVGMKTDDRETEQESN